jgi:excinuclease ABC subunit A
MNDKFITIKGARQHNLQNIDVRIPRDKLVVFTGLSGSGKSSLAFDTIYAEGQRRYVESLSSYARQFLGQMDKPDVDYIEGLSPAISIDQKTTSRNPRSTVGTVTEIYDYLRLLYARIGEAFCPNCGKPIRQQSIEQMADAVLALGNGQKLMILAPVIDGRKGMHQKVLSHLVKEGYVRVRVDGDIYLLSDDIPMDKNKKHTIEVVVDRIVVKEDIVTRLTDSLETAARLGEGVVRVLRMDTGEVMTFSQHFSCPDCHISLPEIEPRLFSFNSPYGACPACAGIGSTMEVDPDLCLPDPSVSFAEGAVMALSNNPHAWFMRQLEGLLRLYGFTPGQLFC